MKRFVAMALTAMLVCMAAMNAFAESGNQTTIISLENGTYNVEFEHGYHGMCIDNGLDDAAIGDVFFVQPTRGHAMHNDEGTDVSNTLKMIIVDYFDDFFMEPDGSYIKDENGYYQLSEDIRVKPETQFAASEVTLQHCIWHYTDGFKLSSTRKQFRPVMQKVLEGVTDSPSAWRTIPDYGETRILADGTEIIFEFRVFNNTQPLQDGKSSHQDFLAFRIYDKPDDPPALPQTGDAADIILWMGAIILGLVGLTVRARKYGALRRR